MKASRLLAVAACACMSLISGCESDSDAAGTFAGTWTGRVCARRLTMRLRQNGTSLTGDYTLDHPPLSEALSGVVSGESTPAVAVLCGGENRRFEITFGDYNTCWGGYYVGGDRTCEVRATKR